MPQHIIQSITLKGDYPTVKYSIAASANELHDCIFPGKQSDTVLPTMQFDRTIHAFAEILFGEYLLSNEYEWKLGSVSFIYDDEDGKLSKFRASLTGFSDELGKQGVTVDPQSKQNIAPNVAKALEELCQQCKLFVGGASAQGLLFGDAQAQSDAEDESEELEEDAA